MHAKKNNNTHIHINGTSSEKEIFSKSYRLSRLAHLQEDSYPLHRPKKEIIKKEKIAKKLPFTHQEKQSIYDALQTKTKGEKRDITIQSLQKDIPSVSVRKGVFATLHTEHISIPPCKKQKESVFASLFVERKKTKTGEIIPLPSVSKKKKVRLLSQKIPVSPVLKKEENILQKQTEKKKYKFLQKKRFSQTKKTKKKKKETSFFGEMTRFAITTGIIFLVSFGVMNAPAISEVLQARLNPVASVEKQIALQKVTAKKKISPVLPTAGMKHENRKTYPSLNISVAPLENRIVIPKIGKNIPTVDIPTDALERQDWKRLEDEIQEGLQNGVVHYPGTAEPGQVGNVFITGHSSYYLWDPGKYKDVFARLHDMEIGDEFTIFWNQNVYHYKIRERKVVPPEQTDVLNQPRDKKIATLMTCTPIGTAKDRLILVADQIN